ncbi:MAG: SPOR domain-containing protein [bacterium]
MDPRLKLIEMQETSLKTGSNASYSEDQNINEQNKQNNAETYQAENTENKGVQENSRVEDYDELPYRNDDPDLIMPNTPVTVITNTSVINYPEKPKSTDSQYSRQPTVITTQAPTNKQEDNLILREKIKVEKEPPISMSKVVVGGFSSLSEAKKVSQDLTNSNLNVTPFIKENNGTYSLQVGSFSNSQKAENLSQELKRRNLSAKVLYE